VPLRLACPAARTAVACSFAQISRSAMDRAHTRPPRVEAVQPGEVAQAVRAAPGVHRAGQVLIAGAAVPHDRAGVAGEHATGVDVFCGPGRQCAGR
jgi:hypothetical protein